MNFKNPVITNFGYEICQAHFFRGGTITIDSVKIGKGLCLTEPSSLETVIDFAMEADIVKYSLDEKNISLFFTIENSALTEGFEFREYGIMATYHDTNGNTKSGLYAYAYDDSETPDVVPKFTGQNSFYKAKHNVSISVGSTDNVTVNLKEFTDFTPQDVFDDHANNEDNPHKVTAEQIGLELVPNVATNDQTPTFTEAANLDNIISGEKLSSIFGKIKKAIGEFITHKNAKNPHGTTATDIGAAESSHSHSAANITSGTLAIARGGTGGTTASAARTNLGINALTQNKVYTSKSISFTENQYVTTTIAISKITGYKAVAIAAWQILSDGSGSSDRYITLNNITFNQNEVTVHLHNTKSGTNHVQFWVSILYIKDI